MSAVLLDAEGNEVEPRRVTPRRVRLPRAALDRLAELAGVPSPAEQMVVSSGSLESLGDRLGSLGQEPERPEVPAEEHAEELTDEATDEVADLDALLAASGLLDGGTPSQEGGAVLTVWHSPALAVELELLVSLARGKARVRSWHRNLDDWVVCLSTADGATFELTWLSADDWWLELGRAAWIDTRTLSADTADEPLPAVVETSWDLLLATGEAVQRRRFELLDQMVSDYSGMTLAGPDLEHLETADDGDVRRWHEQLESASRGRLHAAVMGRSERGRPGAGIVEWVLFHDGWRSLTPFTRDGWAMVRIERQEPTDLPRALAVLAAEVAS
ncbi:hypothetical protein J2X46_004237 [Nocardioides sp. BE266]|uniref:hypothetical protein n=1 Tax=Nocardioides sp. BE266 TaxID=2817725 RepID=UPI002861E2D4|nr:hypothetical protein [Nocardioides sp. BE266]MDR7255235.1 hypothetical protein [Nocardioides sp. BE266]